MNCLDFRRACMAGDKLPLAASQHALECTACGTFAQRLHTFDTNLGAALAVPVPEGLADRVLFQHRNKSRRQRPFMKMALAASVLLAVGYLSQPIWVPQLSPADALFAHVMIEEPVERFMHRVGSQAELNASLASAGLQGVASLGDISYFGTCPVPGGTGYHMKLKTAMGEATLLIMPHEPLSTKIVAKRFGMHAVLSPAKSGGYALVGGSAKEISAIDAAIDRSRSNEVLATNI